LLRHFTAATQSYYNSKSVTALKVRFVPNKYNQLLLMMIIMCTELRAFNQTIIAIVLCPEAGIHWAQKRIGYK
jgi:hypothetical protein